MDEPIPTIDFHRIRAHDGAQSGGFEQLAVELFAREHDVARQLVRVNGAGGDGGVEAYTETSAKGKLGMQAKYFALLGKSQWKQIDASVRTALEQHPDLKEYHVYLPLDRTKGRRNTTQGQVEKWERYIQVWSKLPNGADVKFVWRGRHEIELALKNPRSHDLLLYWFGVPQFSSEWLDRLLQASLRTLGDRYQPARHVNGNVGRELDRFVWSPSFERAAEREYVELAEECLTFNRGHLEALSDLVDADERAAVGTAIKEVVRNEYPAYGQRRVDVLRRTGETLVNAVYNVVQRLRDKQLDAKGKRDEKVEYKLYSVERFAQKVSRWVDFLEGATVADEQCCLVLGDAGSGKSHLLAHCAVQARQRNQPALLVLGEQFLGDRPPLIQLCEQIGWNGGPKSLLSALNVAGSLAQRPALLMIDALNESSDRRVWKSHLHSIAREVQQYSHVRLTVSCRSDFIGITLPADFSSGVPEGWGFIQHRGFGDVLAEAVARYFKTYDIRSPHFPPLLAEFRNPLFLDTFCRAFEGRTLPDGPITFKTVMESRISRLAEKLQADIGCDEYHVRQAILDLAERIRENSGNAIEEKVARAAIEPYSHSMEKARSLYTHLLSNGIIVERIDRYWEEDAPVVVRFAFERFSDYFIARSLLGDVTDESGVRSLFEAGGRLAWVHTWEAYSKNRGLARALAVLIPEQFGIELAELIGKKRHRGDVLFDLLDSLPWRSGSSVSKDTERLVLEASQYGQPSTFIEGLLRVSTVPGHPLNANFLHNRLAAKSLPERDSLWTIPICELSGEEDSVPSTLVEWAIQVPQHLVSDDQAALVAAVLLWFGSSNRVAFRSRAALAAIRILVGRPNVVKKLVEKFDAVNDPYVVERVYAVACGVAMREPNGDGLRDLAATVHRLVFATEDVRPHVLQRDYAQTILATAENRGCLDPSINPKSFRPPFNSKMPRIIEEAEVKAIEDDKDWSTITWSVRPEGMGMYGDFGRYVMGYAVHHFLEQRTDEPIPKEPSRHRFDDKRARRWVLQRVQELGWTSELFGEYEKRRHDSRNTEDAHKVERISKKYQWIALRELLGYLSDHHQMRPDWGNGPITYQGAWQIDARRFDPSKEARPRARMSEDDAEELQTLPEAPSTQWVYSAPYPDPFADLDLLADRAAWVKTEPCDPIRLLTAKRENSSEQWLAVDGFWKWKEPRILRVRHGWDGRCEMWIHARSWLVKTQEVEGFLARIRKLQFWGNGCHGVSLGSGWIGEYPYGAVFAEAREYSERPDEWTKEDDCRHVRTACDWDERGSANVPSPQLCDLLQARWSGEGATFLGPSDDPVATNAPLPNTSDTPPCIVREDRLRAGLSQEGLQIVWAVVGERRCWNGDKMVGDVEMQFSGVYTLTKDSIEGGLTVVETIELPLRQ